ncbi:MAG: hypothetical protein IPH93_09240 [Saprospiraceae bacterium]|nr:hypothetical protein [Saprospiraceae bacterium]MBK9630276.1 hypothetical protein [Saprospiraceae bacterium]
MENEVWEELLKDWKPNCYCEEGEEYCGTCEVCEKPGHLQQCPMPIPYTGCWCDECAKKLIRLYHSGNSPMEAITILFNEAKNKESSV